MVEIRRALLKKTGFAGPLIRPTGTFSPLGRRGDREVAACPFACWRDEGQRRVAQAGWQQPDGAGLGDLLGLCVFSDARKTPDGLKINDDTLATNKNPAASPQPD
ncbi:hypothetical protein BBJ66_12595 [Rhizobium sp. RSm-3]|nr:hypothetical protein BBJ66_12595 [Rhizobium sp. RSm-3]